MQIITLTQQQQEINILRRSSYPAVPVLFYPERLHYCVYASLYWHRSTIKEHKDVDDALNAAIGKKANQTELDTHTGNNTIHIISPSVTNLCAES